MATAGLVNNPSADESSPEARRAKILAGKESRMAKIASGISKERGKSPVGSSTETTASTGHDSLRKRQLVEPSSDSSLTASTESLTKEHSGIVHRSPSKASATATSTKDASGGVQQPSRPLIPNLVTLVISLSIITWLATHVRDTSCWAYYFFGDKYYGGWCPSLPSQLYTFVLAGAGLCTMFQLSHDLLRRRTNPLRAGLSVIRVLCLYAVFLFAFARLFSQYGDRVPSNIIAGIKKYSDRLRSSAHSHDHGHHHAHHHHEPPHEHDHDHLHGHEEHHHHHAEEFADVNEASQDEALSGDEMTLEEWLQQFPEEEEEEGVESSKYQENL